MRHPLTWIAVFVSVVLPAHSAEQMFYNEVAKEQTIYVFADGERFDAFQKSGGTESGTVITRPGYGPNGETVVFDSQDAINLYNFKHDLPGEYVPTAKVAKEAAKPNYPSGKFSGLMFGDYYWYDKWHQDEISDANPNSVEGQQGFQFRRIYVTYDLSFSEKLSTRFRLEMNSNGQFINNNLEPFVKDAHLRWTYTGKQQATLGIAPSLTFDWLESFWGMRHIEKTPADLYRLDASRDFGLTASGPVGVDGLRYAAQIGNESGNGSEIDQYKIVRLEGRYERDPGIALEAFFSYADRANGQERTTAQGFAGYRFKTARAGAQYLWQERRSGVGGVPDQTIQVWSGFAIWDFMPKKADVFFRVDAVDGKQGATETGLPGAEGIDYLILSSASEFTTWIAGAEWYLHPSVRVGPNVELVKYTDDPDPVNFPGRDEDRIYRITFYWTF